MMALGLVSAVLGAKRTGRAAMWMCRSTMSR